MQSYNTGRTEKDVRTGEILPQWMVKDRMAQPLSVSNVTTMLQIHGTQEQMTLPVLTSTTVYEVKKMIAVRLGVEPSDMEFVIKQGCFYRTQTDTEEVRRKVVIRGIKSFTRVRMAWNEPLTIIGAGHLGLRLLMHFLKHEEQNVVLYETKGDVGGTSWIEQANKTSKLQTELGTYHLQFDEDYTVPTNMSTWPNRDELLQHFRQVSRDYGLYPYIRLNTTVKSMIVDKGPRTGSPNLADQTYKLELESGVPSEVEKKLEEVSAAGIFLFPGNLSVPRRETYTGEDLFGGSIHYAMHDNVDYTTCEGQEVAIVGHGAFAVENIRTCCEYSCKKIWLICRRKNLSCPRVTSWFINQAHSAISGRLMMESMQPMYDLIGFDPWTYYAVIANEKRTTVTISQKARFGIGDVYFLAIAMGVCEVVVDQIKRLSRHTVHLEGGTKLGCTVMLKLLGFTGQWDNDRLMGVKELTGFWVNEDCRRALFAEPISVSASNFGGTSFSPGARAWIEYFSYFIWFPKDFASVVPLLPRHKADPQTDRPAYVIDARHGASTGITLDAAVLALQESGAKRGLLKRNKQLECHPPRIFLEECAAEWEEYGRKLERQGAPRSAPLYPYTHEMVDAFLQEELKEIAAK